MRYLFCFLFLVGLIACKKCEDESCYLTILPNNVPPAKPWNVVNDILLCCDNNGIVSWTGPNFYEVQFNLTGPKYAVAPDYGINVADYHTGGIYGAPDTARQFYLKYVGPQPLFDTGKISFRNQWYLSYLMDNVFLHKPLFEARFVSNDSLFQTFLFGDSGTVSVAYFYTNYLDVDPNCGWTCGVYQETPYPLGLTNDTLTKIFSRYISRDGLGETVFHWGNLGSL